jgi:hypothetical protein
LFPAAHFGRAYGSLRLCMFPLTLTCTPLIGLVYDRYDSYIPAFAIFAALFVIAALVAAHLLPPLEGSGGARQCEPLLQR